jgi:hypothetical protein
MDTLTSFVIHIDDDIDAIEAPEDSVNVFADPVAIQKWNDHTVSFYFKSLREVAPYLSTWRFNRKINEDHKNKIKESLMSCSNPHLMGTIQVMRDKKGNCRIINGQHRIVASLEILEQDINMDFNMNIMFEVYDTATEDVSEYTIHDDVETLFNIANISLAVEPEDAHHIFCKKLVNAMGQDKVLSKGMIDKASGTVQKPRILAKTMFEHFKEHLPREHNMDVEDVITKIKKINVQLSLMPNIELFGRHQPAETKQNQRARAHKIGFFLNLDCKYTPSEWIPWLAPVLPA